MSQFRIQEPTNCPPGGFPHLDLLPASAAGWEGQWIERELIRAANSAAVLSMGMREAPPNLEERLYDAKAAAKFRTAQIAMHLDPDWRAGLFQQIDNLLDHENWEPEDVPILDASFVTFLRLILFVRPTVRPGIGCTSDGNIIATWTSGTDRLTVVCKAHDQLQWVLGATVNAEFERATGQSSVRRSPAVLAPYAPERWFHGRQNPS